MPGSGPIRVEGFVERLQDAIEGHAVDADMVVEPFHMTRPGDACKACADSCGAVCAERSTCVA